MSSEAAIEVVSGKELVSFEGNTFALGLHLPERRTLAYPTLSTMTPLLPMDEIRKIVGRSDFLFGRKYFDSSWITNQNGYGSCAGYGASSALAKARVLRGQPRVDLSGDFLYSLVNDGRDRGSGLEENMRAMMSRGVCTKETVPLGGIYRNKYDTRVADKEAMRFRGHELYAVPDEQSMATALAMRVPVVVAIHVTSRWRQFDSDDILAAANGVGNHCEHVDDIMYSTKHSCFLYRKATSHGVNYSGDGYCWTTWERHYKRPSRHHMFYAVPSAIDDPLDTNPSFGEQEIEVPRLTIQSSDGCVWCGRWKATEEPKARAAGYRLESGSVPGRGVPRFTLHVGSRSETQVGFWKFEEIEETVARLRG
ncbi:MAG: C1 family peptidase [Planctomycetota bacterium]